MKFLLNSCYNRVTNKKKAKKRPHNFTFRPNSGQKSENNTSSFLLCVLQKSFPDITSQRLITPYDNLEEFLGTGGSNLSAGLPPASAKVL